MNIYLTLLCVRVLFRLNTFDILLFAISIYTIAAPMSTNHGIYFYGAHEVDSILYLVIVNSDSGIRRDSNNVPQIIPDFVPWAVCIRCPRCLWRTLPDDICRIAFDRSLDSEIIFEYRFGRI